MQAHNRLVIDKVLKKIEDELDFITIEELIAYSGFSYFHFHRLFVAYVGESLKQYLRRIRLERSARDLNYRDIPVTEVAMSAGYATPSAFNKAFKAFFGVSPTSYKEQRPAPKEYPMIEPIRIETLKPFDVYCARHIGAYDELGEAWERLMSFVYPLKIKAKKELLGPDAWAIGIGYDNPDVTPTEKLRSDACISADDDVDLAEGIDRKTIAGGQYAVFLHKGPYDQLAEVYRSIFNYWVKENDAVLRDEPVFERYLNRDPRRTKPENLKTEIYLPIA